MTQIALNVTRGWMYHVVVAARFSASAVQKIQHFLVMKAKSSNLSIHCAPKNARIFCLVDSTSAREFVAQEHLL
jgi:hypothetical protein